MVDSEPQRIAKFIAHSGLCSRREAEKLIFAGKVCLNGEVLYDPATKVTQADEILVNGSALDKKPATRLWAFHKPVETITSNNDPQGRVTIFELLPQNMPRVISIGRLDYKTEGLLLLTNDGELARYFELPKNAVERVYRVRVMGEVTRDKIAKLERGVSLIDEDTGQKIHYAGMKVEYQNRPNSRNHWLTLTLTEGKNREIRKVCQSVGLVVSRLIRTSYGDYSLGDLQKGELIEVDYEK